MQILSDSQNPIALIGGEKGWDTNPLVCSLPSFESLRSTLLLRYWFKYTYNQNQFHECIATRVDW